MALADDLIKKGVLKNPLLIEAFYSVDRKDFVRDSEKELAYYDQALSIGEGQTISQPWTVAFMLEILDPKPVENIMEIGYGSGWVTTLLAKCGSNVYAIERIPKICEFGKKNIEKFLSQQKYDFGRIIFFCQDGTLGLPVSAEEVGGFDKIIAAAASEIDVPQAWKDQLRIGGKIIAPVGSSIIEYRKTRSGKFKSTEHEGFAFVPLIGNDEK